MTCACDSKNRLITLRRWRNGGRTDSCSSDSGCRSGSYGAIKGVKATLGRHLGPQSYFFVFSEVSDSWMLLGLAGSAPYESLAANDSSRSLQKDSGMIGLSRPQGEL
jgi:hypothetical protein